MKISWCNGALKDSQVERNYATKIVEKIVPVKLAVLSFIPYEKEKPKTM